jgi:hypothetical protein
VLAIAGASGALIRVPALLGGSRSIRSETAVVGALTAWPLATGRISALGRLLAGEFVYRHRCFPGYFKLHGRAQHFLLHYCGNPGNLWPGPFTYVIFPRHIQGVGDVWETGPKDLQTHSRNRDV